jgi:hypothetical protein
VANRHSIQIQHEKKPSVYEVIFAASQNDKDGVDQPQTDADPEFFLQERGRLT